MNKILTIPDDVLSQEVNGETVLLNLNNESYFGLDHIGTRIWQLLIEHGELQTVYSIMLKEYDIDEEILKQDIEQFTTKLVNAGLATLGDN